MPDSITPVGTQNKYDPMQGINMLSGVLGIQQQQQQLQIAQGEAQKSQQLMHERQSIQQMMHSGKDDQGQSIIGEDGSPDPAKILPALGRMAPLSGQQFAQGILKTHTDKLGLQEASRALDINHRNALQGMVQSVAAGMDPQEAVSTMRDYVKQHPEAAPTEKYMEGFVQHIGNAKDPDQRAHLAQSLASMMQPGQAVETRPQNASVQTAKGSLQGAVAPAVAGGAFSPSTFTQRGIGPTEQPGYLAQAAAAGSYGGGTATSDVQRANEVGADLKGASNTIRLSKQVDELAKAINSGGAAKDVSKALQYLGFGSLAEARTQLQKDLGQLRGVVASRAGSDARASEVLEGYPTDTTPENTIHYAMDYIRGSARQTIARGDLLQQYKKKDPQALSGFQAADNALVSHTDPLMHEFMALGPEERAGFYRRNFKSAQEAQAFKDSVTAHQKRTQSGVQNGP